MAKRALDRFARPTFHDKRLAFGEAPDWCIGCEGRSRVPAFEAEQIVGDLHDPLSDRLALAGLHRRPKQTRHIGLWRGVALDHLDAFARLQGRKVGRRGFDFGVSGQLRKLDHELWRSSPREGCTTRAALVVGHLLDDVALRQPCKVCVFRTAGSSGAVTKSACEHTGFAAVGDDVRQRAVVAGVPNRSNETITQLTPGVAGRAIWHANWLSIIDWRRVVGAQAGGLSAAVAIRIASKPQTITDENSAGTILIFSPPSCSSRQLMGSFPALAAATRRRASMVGGKTLVDRLSTKSEVEDGKSVTSSAQPNGCPPTPCSLG